MLGVRLLHSEYTTGKSHGGRIDTLGIDENGSPVIIEYKRAITENVINQGLFYLDWLLDHRGEYTLLVMQKLGADAAEEIDWTGPRLICIAGDFTKYDEHAVKQINRNIDLVRYRRFGEDLLAFELVHRTSAASSLPPEAPGGQTQTSRVLKQSAGDKHVSQAIEELDTPLRDVYESLRAYILALGDDIQEKQLKLYMAYRRIKNCAEIVVRKKTLVIYAKIDPATITLETGFTRDVSKIGHWGIGQLEITVSSMESLRKAESLLLRSYEEA
jgi:predicted transport protein